MQNNMKLIYDMVDLILDNMDLREQAFAPSVMLTRIKGEANINWTTCFERKCSNIKDEWDRKICKERCKLDFARQAVGKVRALRPECKNSKNQRSCLNIIKKNENAWYKRIEKINKAINDIRDDKAKYIEKTRKREAG